MKRFNKTFLSISNPILIGLMLLSSILIPISALSVGHASRQNQAGTPEANLISLGRQLQPAFSGTSSASGQGGSNVYVPIIGKGGEPSQKPVALGTQTITFTPDILSSATLTPEGFISPTPTITDTSNPNFTATLSPSQTQTLAISATQTPAISPTQTIAPNNSATPSSGPPTKTPSGTILPTTSANQLCGEISQSMVWTQAASPYVVTCDITIDSQAVITLEPGAIIKLSHAVNIVVDGTLFASSIPDFPVVFTSIKDDTGGDTNGDGSQTSPAPGDWGTIQVSSVGQLSLTSAIIHYGTDAINITNGEADLDTAAILNNLTSGITSNGGRVSLTGSQVMHNPVGIKAVGGSLTVTLSTISNNDRGIYIVGTPILTISHNSITDNTSFGIFNGSTSNHVVATNNWWGDLNGPKPYPNATGNSVNFASHHDAACNCTKIDDIYVNAQPWLTVAP